jgi:hypothetical protein
MEPTTTTAATGFAISKIYYGLSALVVSMAVLFMRKNPKLNNHGRIATGAIVGGSAVGFGVTFGGFIAIKLGMNPDDANVASAIGGTIGLFTFTVVKVLVNWFDKMEEKDIVEVAQEVRGAVSGTTPAKKAPVRKVPAKKAPAKKAAK